MPLTQTCHWHPTRETRLACTRCGRPICVECLRQHPVGLRCKECDLTSRLPTYRVSTAYLARGLSAIAVLGLGGGLVLSILDLVVGTPFIRLLLMFGFGYVAGEGVSVAVNRRRGLPYQSMAAVAVLLALSISLLGSIPIRGLLLFDMFTIIGGVIAVLTAANRLRP